MMEILDKIRGVEYSDFLLVDLASRSLFVFERGVKPEGERVTVEKAPGLTASGRAVWFTDVSPNPPIKGDWDLYLLFVPDPLSWDEVVFSAEGYHVAVGVASFYGLYEQSVKRGPRLLSLLRRTAKEERILVAEIVPLVISETVERSVLVAKVKQLMEAEAELERLRLKNKELRRNLETLTEAYREVELKLEVMARKLGEVQRRELLLGVKEARALDQIAKALEEPEEPSIWERLILRRKGEREEVREAIEEARAEEREVVESE